MNAYITPTNIPGLYDVVLESGVSYGDFTLGQLFHMSVTEGWNVILVAA